MRKILDLLNEESVSGESSVYKLDEKSYCECLQSESIAKVQFKYFFSPYVGTSPLQLRLNTCMCVSSYVYCVMMWIFLFNVCICVCIIHYFLYLAFAYFT